MWAWAFAWISSALPKPTVLILCSLGMYTPSCCPLLLFLMSLAPLITESASASTFQFLYLTILTLRKKSPDFRPFVVISWTPFIAFMLWLALLTFLWPVSGLFSMIFGLQYWPETSQCLWHLCDGIIAFLCLCSDSWHWVRWQLFILIITWKAPNLLKIKSTCSPWFLGGTISFHGWQHLQGGASLVGWWSVCQSSAVPRAWQQGWPLFVMTLT